jgi:hypothetical protein
MIDVGMEAALRQFAANRQKFEEVIPIRKFANAGAHSPARGARALPKRLHRQTLQSCLNMAGSLGSRSKL